MEIGMNVCFYTKFVPIFAFLSIMPILILSQVGQGQTLTRSYISSGCGISIEYPPNWKTDDISDEKNTTTSNSLVILQPRIADGGFQIKIDLSNISKSGVKSLEDLKDYERNHDIIPPLKKMVSLEPAQVSGYPALKVTYTEGLHTSTPIERSKIMAVHILANNRDYLVSYQADSPEIFAKNLQNFEDILQTFKISEPNFRGLIC